MHRIHSIIVITFLLTCCWPLAGRAADQPTSPGQLLDVFKGALQSNDKAKLSSLYNWEGVDAQMKSMSERMLDNLLQYPIKDAMLAPLPEDFRSEFSRSGITFRPNVSVKGMIKITYGEDGPPNITGTSIPYGQKGDYFYIPNTIQEKTDYDGPPDVTLNVSVHGMPPVKFSGVYVYMASGKEKKEVFEGEGNMSKAFWGQYIKACEVKKISGDGWIKLVLNEDGKSVFESDKTDTQEPIKYKKTF